MNDTINDRVIELSKSIAGQMDAHLIESIISLFNRGVLVHYVRTPRTNFDHNNLKMTIEAASGVTFEGRERLVELEKQLKEANEVIDFYGDERNWSKPYERQGVIGRQCKRELHDDGGKRAKEYKAKYIDSEVKSED